MVPARELNARQKLFCIEYLKDLNASQAAIRAGYSKKNADVDGPRLLVNAGIAAEIQAAMNKRAKRVEIEADKVLQEIALLAFSNMGDYIQIQKDGSFFIDFSTLTREQKASIQECTVEEYTDGHGKDARPVRRTKFKLADKGINLERLGKHLKLFTEVHEHKNAERERSLDQLSADELQQFAALVSQRLSQLLTVRVD